MAMNSLEKLAHVLETGANEIHVDEVIRKKAVVPIQRMLEFSKPSIQSNDSKKQHAVPV
jgi:quinolinate synthase